MLLQVSGHGAKPAQHTCLPSIEVRLSVAGRRQDDVQSGGEGAAAGMEGAAEPPVPPSLEGFGYRLLKVIATYPRAKV